MGFYHSVTKTYYGSRPTHIPANELLPANSREEMLSDADKLIELKQQRINEVHQRTLLLQETVTSQSLKDQIKAARTKAELDTIVDNRGE